MSLPEKEVNKIFQRYESLLIKKLGKEETDDEQLRKLGYKLLGSRFRGVFPQDELDVSKTGMFVMNNHTSGQPGEHWVFVYSTPKTVYIHDSFGRPSKTFLPILYKNIKTVGKKCIDFDRSDTEQKITTAVCGPIALAVGLTVKQVGIKNALKL